MDERAFATRFGQIYREFYQRAVRRIDDGRDALSAETSAFLLHLAQAGPSTLSELSLHFGRALSTLSVKVAALEAEGWLARQRDEQDGRRALIWLTENGRAALLRSQEVLDAERLAIAGRALSAAERTHLLATLNALLGALPRHEGGP